MSVTPPLIALNAFDRQWSDTCEAVHAAVERVGASGWYILGNEVRQFEQALCAILGASYVVGCGNGLDAIEIALRVTGIEPGEQVLTTPLSAFATTLAIVRAGGKPVFVDTDSSGLIDLDEASSLLKHQGIRFMLPVHLYGQALNLVKLDKLSKEFSLIVIEDCAQAIGAAWHEQPVGSVGRCSIVSFYPTKNLGALGDAGAFFTNDLSLADRARSLRDYGQSAKYVHDEVGLNSRLDELQAAIMAQAFLPRLSAWTDRRRAIARCYLERIRNSDVTPLALPQGSNSVWHLFPVMLQPQARDGFREHLAKNGVQTAIHYPHLIPAQKALRQSELSALKEQFPKALAITNSQVSLPIHPYLTDNQVSHVVESVNSWRGGK